MALTTSGNLLLVEQYRPPVEGRVIELPAGLVGDSGPEEALEAAKESCWKRPATERKIGSV